MSNLPLGADISHFQGDFDFSTFDREGITFFFAKASEGTAYVDPMFAEFMLQTKWIRGAYHFLTDEDITQQAQHFADTVRFDPGMLAFVDVERSPELTSIDPHRVRQFCDLMAQHWNGYRIGVYINLGTLQSFDWTPVASGDYWLFLAEWNMIVNGVTSSGPWPFVAFHQYGNDVMSGTSHDVDAFLGTPEQLVKYTNQNGATLPPTGQNPPPVPSSHTYTVQAGDTLSGIAARFGMSWQQLWNFGSNQQKISNPDRIFPGEVLDVPGEVPAPAPSTGCDYTIQSGDTLSAIASHHGMSWQNLWNFADNRSRIANPDLIYAGQVIKVPC